METGIPQIFEVQFFMFLGRIYPLISGACHRLTLASNNITISVSWSDHRVKQAGGERRESCEKALFVT